MHKILRSIEVDCLRGIILFIVEFLIIATQNISSSYLCPVQKMFRNCLDREKPWDAPQKILQ